MPSLKDTELRILLVLIRQTIGWQRDGRPVVLSYKTLMKKTGRHSEAIAKALHALREAGLIHISTRRRRQVLRTPNLSSSKADGQH
jgi:predicted transcriptional regulator